MTQDGATVAVDWEIPPLPSTVVDEQQRDHHAEELRRTKREVLHGPLHGRVVVLILHGLNNHSNFGYVRSLMRACTDRGWVAACMNFRGCADGNGAEFGSKQSTSSSKMTTPRGYNGAYTGDLRCTVWRISARLGPTSMLFLVGNSLGANLVTKYLGEEGLSGTLPKCVAGGVALGNPMSINSRKASKYASPLMALGIKKFLVENWSSIRHFVFRDRGFRTAIRRALLVPTLGQVDDALAPTMVRNDPNYPFSFRVGYENGEAYWKEASSFRYVQHISVPTLQLIAGDDFLIFHPFRGRLRYCMTNPNVLVVETKCGGHLGWQESPPDSSGGLFGLAEGTSWADAATTDFIAAVLEAQQHQPSQGSQNSHASSLQQQQRQFEKEDLSYAKESNTATAILSRL